MTNVAVRETDTTTLVVDATYPHTPPETLFRYWVESALITRWWPSEAEIDPRAGGAYHLAWPSMNWHLRGRYTTFETGRALAFTWRWDTTPPDYPDLTVTLRFSPDGSGGTRLVVEHGPYGSGPDDAQARQGHIDGWTHFLAQLGALLASEN